MSKILVIDDEVQIRSLLARMLGLEGYEVCQAGDCKAALKQLETQSPDVALCDVFLPDGNGVDLVLNIKKLAPNVEVILLTAHGNIPDGVQAIKNGAFDYITKGDDNNKIIPLISRAVEKAKMNVRLEKLEKKVGQMYSFDSILGESKALKEAVLLAQKVSVTDVPVLLTGETGTGKEVFAQAIHYSSKRSKQNFVAVNCSSFSKELLESEMFGHRAGSFTGALKDKKGLFEEANNGTIFLDEIGEMPPQLQVKLLRALQQGEIQRVGSDKSEHVDVRVIAATNRDLRKEVEERRFREDLYFRLNVISLEVPPLRQRKEDIPLLAAHFLSHYAERNHKNVKGFSAQCMDMLLHYDWPGNVRELQNAVERAVILCTGEYVTGPELPVNIAKLAAEAMPKSSEVSSSLAGLPLEEVERRAIEETLRETGDNKSAAARKLGITRATLHKKLRKYGSDKGDAE